MKLQGQEQQDTSILGENFEVKSRRPLWVQRLITMPVHDNWVQRGLFLAVAWLILCSAVYVGVMIGYAPAFQKVAGMDNPVSAIRDAARTRQDIRSFEAEYVANMDKVKVAMGQLAQLRSTQSLSNNPTLLAVKSVRDTRTAWDTVLNDIDGAMKKTVESNDILQRIVIGSITLSDTENTGNISKVKVYANGDQSSLALAARFIQVLEASTSLKDIKSSEPTTQQETASGAVLTYTPMDISFSIQKDQEVTTSDPDRSVRYSWQCASHCALHHFRGQTHGCD